MSQSPDEIRAEIERTRRNLSTDVDALGHEASPSTQVHRQTDKVKGRANDLKERVMGAAHDARDSTGSATSSLSDAAHDAPGQAQQKVRGNPLAAGVIAFGVGMLASALIPTSQREQQAAEQVKAKAQPLAAELGDAAKESAQNLKEPAQEAAQSVKGSAQSAAQDVQAEGQSAAQGVKGQAQGSAETVRDSRS